MRLHYASWFWWSMNKVWMSRSFRQQTVRGEKNLSPRRVFFNSCSASPSFDITSLWTHLSSSDPLLPWWRFKPLSTPLPPVSLTESRIRRITLETRTNTLAIAERLSCCRFMKSNSQQTHMETDAHETFCYQMRRNITCKAHKKDEAGKNFPRVNYLAKGKKKRERRDLVPISCSLPTSGREHATTRLRLRQGTAMITGVPLTSV